MPQYTSNMDLYKVDLETDGNSTFNIKTMLNDNWDKIDSKYDEQDGRIRGNSEVVNEVKEDIGDKSELKTEEKSSLVGAVNEVSAGMADIAYYSTNKLNIDDNGIYTQVEHKRADGTLIIRSQLSGGSSPCYKNKTETKYAIDGTVEWTKTYEITYDVNGNVESEVLL
ncbi:hypothetical protein [Vallitalea guaymasensis]|uniref:hypothetical protein n=1 Tax=Vallitalea guaymasensis TaxID=1185412 RepID=UPI0023553C9F|nr:hypothetical protein [Vallitalea guaymasensis]